MKLTEIRHRWIVQYLTFTRRCACHIRSAHERAAPNFRHLAIVTLRGATPPPIDHFVHLDKPAVFPSQTVLPCCGLLYPLRYVKRHLLQASSGDALLCFSRIQNTNNSWHSVMASSALNPAHYAFLWIFIYLFIFIFLFSLLLFLLLYLFSIFIYLFSFAYITCSF